MPKEQESIFNETEIIKDQFKAFEQMAQNDNSLVSELKSFSLFNDKIKHLVDDLMTPYFLPDPFDNENYKPMPPEVFYEFIQTYNELFRIMSDLQQEIQTKLDSGAQERKYQAFLMPLQAILRYTDRVMEKDIATFSGMNPKNGIILPEAIMEARSRKLTITQEKIDKIGGNLSSRIPVTFTDDQGKEHKGFFTKDKIIHFKEPTRKILMQAVDQTDDPEDFKNLMKQYLNTIFDDPEIANDPTKLHEALFTYTSVNTSGAMLGNIRVFAYALASQGQILSTEYDRNITAKWSFFGKEPKNGEEDTRTEQQKRNQAAFDKKFGRAGEQMAYYRKLNDYFDSLLHVVAKYNKVERNDMFLNLGHGQTMLMSQMEGSSLYQRNSAMSAVATFWESAMWWLIRKI